MQLDKPLDAIPLWGLFGLTLLLVLFCIESGYRLGRYRHKLSKLEKESPVGEMVGATLGLLAFLLAFTFGLAAARFDSRQQLMLDEANAIGTAYLRAGLLSEDGQGLRSLLREYVDLRLETPRSGTAEQGARRLQELQNRLWAQTEALAKKSPASITVGLFIQSLNDIIDLQSKRTSATFYNRIPGIVWAALYAIAIFSFSAMGYHSGITGTSRSPVMLPVGLTFSLVMWLIADLDRPLQGLLRENQQSMIDLQHSMQSGTTKNE